MRKTLDVRGFRVRIAPVGVNFGWVAIISYRNNREAHQTSPYAIPEAASIAALDWIHRREVRDSVEGASDA